jgi:hypothetical protein
MRRLRDSYNDSAALEVFKTVINTDDYSRSELFQRILGSDSYETQLLKNNIDGLEATIDRKDEEIARLNAELDRVSPKETIEFLWPLMADQRIAYFKAVRAVTGMGLKDAKEWVEARIQDGGRSSLTIQRGVTYQRAMELLNEAGLVPVASKEPVNG